MTERRRRSVGQELAKATGYPWTKADYYLAPTLLTLGSLTGFHPFTEVSKKQFDEVFLVMCGFDPENPPPPFAPQGAKYDPAKARVANFKTDAVIPVRNESPPGPFRHANQITRDKCQASAIGLVQIVRRGYYALTEKGASYARDLVDGVRLWEFVGRSPELVLPDYDAKPPANLTRILSRVGMIRSLRAETPAEATPTFTPTPEVALTTPTPEVALTTPAAPAMMPRGILAPPTMPSQDGILLVLPPMQVAITDNDLHQFEGKAQEELPSAHYRTLPETKRPPTTMHRNRTEISVDVSVLIDRAVTRYGRDHQDFVRALFESEYTRMVREAELNVTQRWIEEQGPLFRHKVEGYLMSSSRLIGSREAGLIEDHLDDYFTMVIEKDKFAKYIEAGKEPTPGQIAFWVFRFAVSAWKKEGRDGHMRGQYGSRTQGELGEPEEEYTTTASWGDNRLWQEYGEDGEPSLLHIIDESSDIEDKVAEAQFAEQAYEKIESVLQRHYPTCYEKYRRILWGMAWGRNPVDIAAIEGVPRRQASNIFQEIVSTIRNSPETGTLKMWLESRGRC